MGWLGSVLTSYLLVGDQCFSVQFFRHFLLRWKRFNSRSSRVMPTSLKLCRSSRVMPTSLKLHTHVPLGCPFHLSLFYLIQPTFLFVLFYILKTRSSSLWQSSCLSFPSAGITIPSHPARIPFFMCEQFSREAQGSEKATEGSANILIHRIFFFLPCSTLNYSLRSNLVLNY